MVNIYKDWHEKLPFALHGYKTSVCTSTGETPFLLVYYMEVVLPIKVKIPPLRVIMEANLYEEEWIQSRFYQMILIDEKRLTALFHGQIYHRRLKTTFDKKVRPRVFWEGDQVLKTYSSIHSDP